MSAQFVYITCKDNDEAEKIGRELLENHLVACVNIMDGMRSMYWWEGEIHRDTETVLIAKTRQARVEAVVEKVKQIHSYECPCVVSLSVVGGNAEYLEWVLNETGFEGRKTELV